jgi:hypothetical protein
MIAVSEAMEMRRIQVKYREDRNGAVEVPFGEFSREKHYLHPSGMRAGAVVLDDVLQYGLAVHSKHLAQAKAINHQITHGIHHLFFVTDVDGRSFIAVLVSVGKFTQVLDHEHDLFAHVGDVEASADFVLVNGAL